MPDTAPAQVALALGSNIGDRLASLRAAVRELAPYVDIAALSPVYETAPAYVTDQPAFLNAVILGTTKLEPFALLRTVKNMESDIGRMPTFRYGPRVIDIDIIFHGDRAMATAELTIPHARLGERDFVLRPLADIAPVWRHPHNGKTAAEMLAVLPDGGMICLGKIL